MATSRNYTIDALKAFGIFCIVLGHNDYTILGDYIYSFHIPLFFFVSGLVFNPDRYRSFNYFLVKRTQALLIPYFLISIILFVFWFLVGRKFGASADMNLSPINNLIGIFYAQGGNEYMDWGIPMWFLPCLFVLSLLFYFIAKLKTKHIAIALAFSGIIGFIYSKHYNIHIPWSIDIAFAAIPFYGTGYLFRDFINKNIFKYKNTSKALLILTITLGLNIIFFYLNSRIDMSKGLYNNYLYMYLSGVGGTVFYLTLLNFLPRIKWISFLGVNTLLIMAFHLRAMTIVKFFQTYILHVEYNSSTLWSIIYAVIQIIILIPLVWIINRYFPILVGKRRVIKNT